MVLVSHRSPSHSELPVKSPVFANWDFYNHKPQSSRRDAQKRTPSSQSETTKRAKCPFPGNFFYKQTKTLKTAENAAEVARAVAARRPRAPRSAPRPAPTSEVAAPRLRRDRRRGHTEVGGGRAEIGAEAAPRQRRGSAAEEAAPRSRRSRRAVLAKRACGMPLSCVSRSCGATSGQFDIWNKARARETMNGKGWA